MISKSNIKAPGTDLHKTSEFRVVLISIRNTYIQQLRQSPGNKTTSSTSNQNFLLLLGLI